MNKVVMVSEVTERVDPGNPRCCAWVMRGFGTAIVAHAVGVAFANRSGPFSVELRVWEPNQKYLLRH